MTDLDTNKIGNLLAVLEPLGKLRSHVARIDCARTLFSVALNEGQNVSDHARSLDLPNSTVSRNLLDLGERDRHMKKGLGLVQAFNGPKHQRIYALTKKGRRLMSEITK